MKKYFYYEDGTTKRFTPRKLYRRFTVDVDEEQKSAGTDFPAWLYDMTRAGVLVEK